MEVIDILYTSDLNKQTTQEKVNEITLDIFGLPEDAENFDEESELRTIFGNYFILCISVAICSWNFILQNK